MRPEKARSAAKARGLSTLDHHPFDEKGFCDLNILQVDSSPQESSVSRLLTTELTSALLSRHPEAVLSRRDLGTEPMPHLTQSAVGSIRTPDALSPEAKAAQAHSDELIGELERSDLLVIGSPMYNFGITSQLKAWFDYVIRAGQTFRYTPEGPLGLLQGKRAWVVETRGGVYSIGAALARDHQEPHLRTMLGFIGISDVRFALAEGLNISPDSRESGLASARAQIAILLSELDAGSSVKPARVA